MDTMPASAHVAKHSKRNLNEDGSNLGWPQMSAVGGSR